jgi:hypothetical protein
MVNTSFVECYGVLVTVASTIGQTGLAAYRGKVYTK